MYPKNATELAGLIAALVPIVLGVVSGFIAVLTRASERRRADWRRINELTAILYNREQLYGHWSQIMAARELGDFRHQRDDIALLIEEVRIFFDGNVPQEHVALVNALTAAEAKLRRNWFERITAA